MRRRVAGQLARVASDADHLAVRIDDDGTDRDVGGGCREHGLLQGEPHQRLVRGGRQR